MSIYSQTSMTNHHGSGLFAQLSETLHVWRQRQRHQNWSRRKSRSGIARTTSMISRQKPGRYTTGRPASTAMSTLRAWSGASRRCSKPGSETGAHSTSRMCDLILTGHVG